jgi:hypothetical protein
LSPATILPEANVVDAANRRRAVLIVVVCTLIIPAAQYLIKLGANQLAAQKLALHQTGSVSLVAAMMGIFYESYNFRRLLPVRGLHRPVHLCAAARGAFYFVPAYIAGVCLGRDYRRGCAA